MQTGASLEWQVFEEREWDDAVADGLIGESAAGGQSAAVATSPVRWLRLAELIAVALAGFLMGTVYPTWRATGMEAETQPAASVLMADETPRLDTHPAPISETDGGPRLTVVTDHFRIEAHPRDLPAVTEFAPLIDARYRQLRRTLGLAAPAGRLSIAVAPHPITTGWRLSGNQLLIASPHSMSAPPASRESALTCVLQEPLTHVALAEAVDDESVRWQWTFMVAGLRQWLQRCPADIDPAPHGVEQAISAYKLVDLLFADADWFNPSEQRMRAEAAASLIAYLVHTYGEERLPDLLAAFGRHNRWETLAPVVFGVPASEFEAGWQAYLADRYGHFVGFSSVDD